MLPKNKTSFVYLATSLKINYQNEHQDHKKSINYVIIESSIILN